MKPGDLITPTGRLVLDADGLHSQAWLEARRWRGHTVGPHSLGYCIGSSDVPSILDLDGVGTPAHVYRNKVYNIAPEPNAAMHWGNVFEGAIALDWCSRNRAVIDEIGLVSRDGAPWHQSTIDRRVRECPVYRGTGERRACGLEVKHVEYVYKPRWNTTNGIPDRITAQIVHQLYVTGFDHMHYAIKVPGDFLMGVIVAADVQKLMGVIVGEVDGFRQKYLIPGIEPAWNLGKPDKMIELDNATYPDRSGVGELDVNGVGDVMSYAELVAQETVLGKRKKPLAARLRELAAGNEIMTFSGERAFWYVEGHRLNVNMARLKEHHAQAYADCVTEKTYPILNVDKAFKPRGEKA